MIILPVICLLIHVNVLSASEPFSKYLDALQEKCQGIIDNNNRALLMKQEVFARCTKWDEINNIKNLTEDTEEYARCLLYFDSFALLCQELIATRVQNISVDVFMPDLKNHKELQVDNVCRNWKSFLNEKKFDHDILLFMTDERKCDKLCITYDDAVYIQCSLAHYYVNFNVTTLVQTNSNLGKTSDVLQSNLNIPQLPALSDVAPGNATRVGVHNPQNAEVLGSRSQLNILQEGAPQTRDEPKSSNFIQPSVNSDNSFTQKRYQNEDRADSINKHDSTLGVRPAAGEVAVQRVVKTENGGKSESASSSVNSNAATSLNNNGALNKNVAPVPNKNAAPAPNNNAAPEPNDNAAPAPKNNVAPEPNINAAPAPINNAVLSAPLPTITKGSFIKYPEVGIPVPQKEESNSEVHSSIKKDQEETNLEQNEQTQVHTNQEQTEVQEEESALPALEADPNYISEDEKDGPNNADDLDENTIGVDHDGKDQHYADGDKDEDEAKNMKQDEGDKVKQKKPPTVDSSSVNENTEELNEDSYFFSYFMVICILFILGYVGYHNRQKVLALVLEGKRGKRQYRGRRPNSANYHKLDSNLEEAISSTCTKNSSHVIY